MRKKVISFPCFLDTAEGEERQSLVGAHEHGGSQTPIHSCQHLNLDKVTAATDFIEKKIFQIKQQTFFIDGS